MVSASRAAKHSWNMCGKIQVPSATLIAAVTSQVLVRPASGTRPGKLPMPGCRSCTRRNTSSIEVAPTLSATVRLRITTSAIISTSLTPAANAAERRPARYTKASITVAARIAASAGPSAAPSVSRNTSASAVSWICTYTTSAAMPATPTTTPSHGARYRRLKKSAWVTRPWRLPAVQICGISQYPSAQASDTEVKARYAGAP